jgi:hypothetical protein
MLRPTTTQLVVSHPPILDLIIWPRMRDNFIKHGMKYCRTDVFGLLFCTLRIRDTPNSDFIVQEEGVEPYVDPEIIKKMSSPNEWVLLDKFWNTYPELVEGLDPDYWITSEPNSE